MPPTPFYLDWTFWTVIVSLIAVALSQFPPIHQLIKPRRLEVEVHSRINLTHKIGNPNVSLHMSMRNNGGRELRVRSIRLNLFRDGKPLLSMPAQNYFENQTDQHSILFVPFSIKPNEHWSHVVNFLNFFDRKTEKFYRSAELAIKTDIQTKFRTKEKEDNTLVAAEHSLVKPFIELFERTNVWEPGEYIAVLEVNSEPVSATYTKQYRFTLYESDCLELKKYTEDYINGGGIYYNSVNHIGISIPLSEHLG
jgi:hypothetical protein